MKKLTIMILGALLLNTYLFADEVSKVGTTALGFIGIDVGSRAVGMGGAYVSVVEDATAMFWNPAGITNIENFQSVFHHSNWIADISFNYFAVVVPLQGIGNLGLNITSLSMDEMERTTIMNPEGTGETFNAGSFAVGACFARNLTDRFSIGFNFKYLNETIYNSSAQGLAFDIGTLFTTRLNGMKIGMSISNYGTKVQMSGRDMLTQVDIDPTVSGNNEHLNADLKTNKFDLPLLFRIGVSMDVLKGAGNSNLLLSIDALHPNDYVESINVGAEYILNNMFALRTGYASLFAEDSQAGLSMGAGINYKLSGNLKFVIDYAYKDFGLLDNIQMFTLGLNF